LSLSTNIKSQEPTSVFHEAYIIWQHVKLASLGLKRKNTSQKLNFSKWAVLRNLNINDTKSNASNSAEKLSRAAWGV